MKFEIRNGKNKIQNRMENAKRYDLQERTEAFLLQVRDLCLKLKRDIINREYIVQLVRAAGSVAANYIEANEHLGPNDLKMRIRICRKETKESQLWLKHILTYEDNMLDVGRINLLKEPQSWKASWALF